MEYNKGECSCHVRYDKNKEIPNAQDITNTAEVKILFVMMYMMKEQKYAQLLTIKTKVTYKPVSKLKTVRKFNNCTISDFINKLSNESWDMVFNSEDINNMFNSFLNDYLRIFNLSFPLQTVMAKNNLTKNKWITKGIKIWFSERINF